MPLMVTFLDFVLIILTFPTLSSIILSLGFILVVLIIYFVLLLDVWLLIQHIHSCSSYLEAISCIHNLRMHYAVVTKTHMSFLLHVMNIRCWVQLIHHSIFPSAVKYEKIMWIPWSLKTHFTLNCLIIFKTICKWLMSPVLKHTYKVWCKIYRCVCDILLNQNTLPFGHLELKINIKRCLRVVMGSSSYICS